MSKSNIGAFYGLTFFICLATRKTWLDGLKGFILGSAVSLGALLILIGSPQKYFEQSFLLYTTTPEQRTRRIAALFFPQFWMMDWYWAALLIVATNALTAFRNTWKLFLLFLGIFFVARLSTATGSMLPTANIPLLGVWMALGFGVIAISNSKITKPSFFLLIVLTVWMSFFSAQRGLGREAWTYNNRSAFGAYELAVGPLKGWKTDEAMGFTIDALVTAFEQQISKEDSLLILTDLQILYSLTGHKSYKGIPFIWAVGEMPSPGKQVNEVRKNILENPPRWIVTHIEADQGSDIDQVVQYLGLRDFLLNDYTPVQTFGRYVIARKK